MKIRRKPPKPDRVARPLHVIGFSSAPPDLADLAGWFDAQYGGPLGLKTDAGGVTEDDAASVTVRTVHGPWSATFRLPVSSADAAAWRDTLGWGHPNAAVVFRPAVVPAQASNLVLHAARLARGLTLLTEGTAFDLPAQRYLNPSDWQDRPLDLFHIGDHVTVEPAEESSRQWIHTRGLAKLGLDEIETFRPTGLPVEPVAERLLEIAEELARLGQSPPVGTVLPLPFLGLTVRVLRYRTAAPAGVTLQLREIGWEPIGDARSENPL